MSEKDDDARVIGQALLDLAARLPEGYHDEAQMGHNQASMLVNYDAGDEVWEIEFMALDPKRNFTLQDSSLEVVARRSIRRDREAARDV
jgi:hypothetical protein